MTEFGKSTARAVSQLATDHKENLERAMATTTDDLEERIQAHLERYPHVKKQMTGGLLVELLAKSGKIKDGYYNRATERDWAEQEISNLREDKEELVNAMKIISRSAPDCGCNPCVGQCLSDEAKVIYFEGTQDLANEMLAKHHKQDT